MNEIVLVRNSVNINHNYVFVSFSQTEWNKYTIRNMVNICGTRIFVSFCINYETNT